MYTPANYYQSQHDLSLECFTYSLDEIFQSLCPGKTTTASIAQLVEHSLPEQEVVSLNPGCTLPKGVKNGTSSSLTDAHIKGVVPGR